MRPAMFGCYGWVLPEISWNGTRRTEVPMKLCHFQPRVVPADKVGAATHPEVLQGVISGETVREVSGDILSRWSVTNRSWPLTDVKLLPPVTPSKIVGLGRNYIDHAAEWNKLPPKEPLIFLKPPSSLLAPEDPIVLPPDVQRVDYEGELAVIISKECSQLQDGDDVRPYIAGYTCLNDVSVRDYQALDKQWTRARALTRFARWALYSKPNSTLPPATWRPCSMASGNSTLP